MFKVQPKPMIVGGKPVVSKDWILSESPWRSETIDSMSVASDHNLETAIALADGAWRSPMPLNERVTVCALAAELINQRKDALIELLIDETGKPRQFATSEVERMQRTFWLASEAGDEMVAHDLDFSYDPRGESFTGAWQRFGVGPTLGFVPYNWPLNLAAHKLAPAIVAGCPIVMKVSPLAPLTTLALGELLVESGVQPGSLSVLHLSNEQAQKALVDDRIRMLSFTGSPEVGWMLKGMVPQKRVTLELGGNAPVIICNDADLELAVSRTTISGYGYAGQVCISAQNVFLHRSVFDKTLSLLVKATRACAAGDPSLPETICGPMIDAKARDRVLSRIKAAKGRIVAEAPAEAHPLLIPPTLLEGVDETDELFTEEVFGPVLNVVPFDSSEKLFEKLNEGRYRLQASIFTRDEELVDRAFARLQFGGVIVNESPSLRFDGMPYGGEGDSGFGREGVRFALDEMTSPRARLTRRT